MTKILFAFMVCLGQEANLFAQNDPVEQIQNITDHIDGDATLKVKEFDANKVYEKVFDGGGIIKIHFDEAGLKKIEKEIGVSFGRLTTIIYFDKGLPIKIIDREENFKWKEDETGWDYSELNQVFQADIYIFDWEMDKNETIKEGRRKISEGSCAIFDYEPLVELGVKLLKNPPKK